MNTKNKVQLIGTVADNPTVNRMETDLLRAAFIIETPSTYFNDVGMKKEGVFKHFCITYGKLAETLDRYVSKGTEIAIEGVLVQASTGKMHVQVNDLLLLSKKTN